MGSASFKVALVGFAQNEAATFESFFRLAARRAPAYIVQDEVMDAEILIVNSDNAQALHLVRYADLEGRVLLVGSHDGGTGWPLQRKPVKLVSVLAAMDSLMGVLAVFWRLRHRPRRRLWRRVMVAIAVLPRPNPGRAARPCPWRKSRCAAVGQKPNLPRRGP